MVDRSRILRELAGSILCFMLMLGCATVDDPRKADIFSFSRAKSQRYIEGKQAELDLLEQRRAELDLEKEKLQRDNERKEKERDVLRAQLSEVNKDVDNLASQLARSKAQSAKLQARRRDLQARIRALKREVAECQNQVQEAPDTADLQKRLDALRQKQRQLEQEYSILSGNPS